MFLILFSTCVCTVPRGLAQQVTLDWKLHDAGKIRQVITNTGGLNAKDDLLFDFPGLINCEFPPNSREEHITEAGMWIGAVVGGTRLVSVAQGEGSPREFFPTGESWDTIWVVRKGDTVNIPFWLNYIGVSDQDFVCRYSDDGLASLRVTNHVPLHLDVIQTSYAWSSYPLDEFIVLNYYIISRSTLDSLYLTSWINSNVGYGLTEAFGLDDESFFLRDRMMQFGIDLPGGDDGDAFSPIAVKVYPPSNALDSLRITYIWYNGRLQGLPSRDDERYAQMVSGVIMEDQYSTGDGTKSMVSFGPYALRISDTLRLTIALVLGQGQQGVYKNADFLDQLVRKNYQVPSPPPVPSLRVETANHVVTLRWDIRPGDANPETYQDPVRSDSAAQPFEGYRVYKSTRSVSGPWTLIAEFDVPNNTFGSNTGLAYEYTDIGLLNNFDYYYTVTAFSKPDTVLRFPSQESSLNGNAKRAVPGPQPPRSVGEVAVVPNPYRGDVPYYSYNPPWEKPAETRARWMEQDRRIQFINLPEQCEIRIYTLAGDPIATLRHNDPTRGYEDWNLTSSVGQAVASGMYLFTAEDIRNGQVQVGKFVIIK